jgi:hypothetical protein
MKSTQDLPTVTDLNTRPTEKELLLSALQHHHTGICHIGSITKVSIKVAKIFLYADDTSIIVTNPEYNGYKLTMNKLFHEVNKWFKTNLLTLNLKNTHHLQFTTMNYEELETHISFGIKQVVNSNCTKFLGLNTDNKLNWKDHIDYLITKLSSLCFIMSYQTHNVL